jgi:transcriptional regulator with XRE-family HTH domain/quercetin dioxygenase-like cupin family protein
MPFPMKESLMALHTPGERIAELRKTYAVDRKTLAERSGVSEELIRRIEEEGLIPDLAPLLKISRALGVRLGTLLDDRNELGPVIARSGQVGEGARFITGIPLTGGAPPSPVSGTPSSVSDTVPLVSDTLSPVSEHQGLIFWSLAADKGGRHMEPFIVDVKSDAEQANSSHEGEEFIHVLMGSIAVDYGKDNFVLNEGDSIYYDSIVPHRVLSAGGKNARILAVIYTPA